MRFPSPLRVSFVALLCLSTVLLSACDNAESEVDANTVFGLVTDNDELDRLEALVRDTELGPMLQTRQNLTLFAPTNLALERLGPDMLTQLTGNPDVLLKILRRHIVPEPVHVEDLRDGDTLTPLEGPPLTVRIEDDRVFVGGARLTIRRTDFETGTGVVHFIDDVVRDHLTLSERLRVTPLASDFADVLQRAGLTDLIDDGEPYTLLIPIDNAFTVFGGDHLQYLLRFENREVLRKIMRHHILPGRVRVEDLDEVDELTSLAGLSLSVEEDNTVRYLGGARVIAAEVETSNGLIYLLDRIVLNHLDLAERIQIHPHLAKYHTLLDRAGILEELRGSEPYTVFLPRDASLESLGEGFVPALVERPDQLLLAAQYTVALGVHDREALLRGGSLPTLSGFDMPIARSNEPGGPVVFAGERSQVTFPPLEAANGLLYTVSPFEHPPGLSLEGQSVFFGLYRFLSLMEQAGLTSILRGDEEHTIFAPTDEALEMASIPPGSVPYRMGAHVVEEAYLLGQLLSGLELTTLSDTPIVATSGMGVYVNGNTLLQHTPRPRNGVFYVIDGALP